MLVLDPDHRIASEEAIQHAYLAKYHDPDDEVGQRCFLSSCCLESFCSFLLCRFEYLLYILRHHYCYHDYYYRCYYCYCHVALAQKVLIADAFLLHGLQQVAKGREDAFASHFTFHFSGEDFPEYPSCPQKD